MKMQNRKNINNNNKMYIHGFILITILVTAKSAEVDITMEAAFQGHCGHTSPCEQLCYEIHDGMYECDCIEGYELNKNGYSCQVINSTMQSKSDEDVLYQKGVSFSAKLDANDKYASSSSYDVSSFASAAASSASYESSNEVVDDESDKYFVEQQQQEKDFNRKSDALASSQENNNNNNNINNNKINTNDYYISAESINFNNEPEQIDVNDKDFINHNNSPDVPEYHHAAQFPTKISFTNNFSQVNIIPTMLTLTTTTKSDTIKKTNKSMSTTTKPTSKTTIKSMGIIENLSVEWRNEDAGDLIENYYNNYNMKGDMSAYDDVNNNQLNLRPLEERNTYQRQGIIIKSDAHQRTLPEASSSSYSNNNNNNNNFTNKQNNSKNNDINNLKWYDNVNFLLNRTTTSRNIENVGYANCPLNCGTDGFCDNNDSQPKCLCSFGKTGKQCDEDMFVHVPKFSKKSWVAFAALRDAYKHLQLHIEFRPEAFDGVLLLSGERDDLTGDFLALLLNKGFVEFWFDCGSGVGSVRSRETIRLNEWNSVVIYRHRWDAWLILNHGSKVQGRSNGLFSRITFREPVFLGGSGNVTGLIKRLPVSTGFSGCIKRFTANGHAYNFAEHPVGDVMQGFNIQDCVNDKCFKYPCQHGGKCLPTDQGAVCLCPMGFVGDLCEIRMDLQIPAFNGSSFLRHGPIDDTALIWLELKIILKPERPDGLILYSGPKSHGDFIALTLNQGFIEFHFDLGSGPAFVRSSSPLVMGQWHTIKISRTARLAVLKVDELAEEMTISPNGFWHLSLPESLFLGGVSHIERLPNVLKSQPFFVGCIQLVDINGQTLSISEALGGTNIENCPHACLAMPCGLSAECLPQLEGYNCHCHDGQSNCKNKNNLSSQVLRKKKKHKYTGNKGHVHKAHKLVKFYEKSKVYKTISSTSEKPTDMPISPIIPASISENNIYDGQISDNYESPYKLKLKEHKHKAHHRNSPRETNAEPMLRIPTHYASFQANGNVLTFGENVKVHIFKGLRQHDGSTPFAINENIFDGDDLTEDYERKQLAQDMRRIMANTPMHKRINSSAILNDDIVQDNSMNMKSNEVQATEPEKSEAFDESPHALKILEKIRNTTETLTDWSMLKQFDLAADYQSHIGVRKNFGACFAGINSYFHYDDAETMRHVRFNLNINMRIKTHSTNGVLLWSGRQANNIVAPQEDQDNFLALGIENGYLHFRYDLGAGEVDIMFNATKVSDGLWHRVRAIRDTHNSYLEVDGRKSAMLAASNNLRQFITNTGLYVGGIPDKAYFTRRKYKTGIVGCISEIVLAGVLKLNFDANTLGTAHNVETGIL